MNFKGRFLVLFDDDLDKYKVANHNLIKNSLWIKKSDLMIRLENIRNILNELNKQNYVDLQNK
jgi:hypothetical protein